MELTCKFLLGSFFVVMVLVVLIMLYSESLFYVNKYKVRLFAQKVLVVFSAYTILTFIAYIILVSI